MLVVASSPNEACFISYLPTKPSARHGVAARTRGSSAYETLISTTGKTNPDSLSGNLLYPVFGPYYSVEVTLLDDRPFRNCPGRRSRRRTATRQPKRKVILNCSPGTVRYIYEIAAT